MRNVATFILFVILCVILGTALYIIFDILLAPSDPETPEQAIKGYYNSFKQEKKVKKEIAKEYIDPKIRNTPKGQEIFDLYNPKNFKGFFLNGKIMTSASRLEHIHLTIKAMEQSEAVAVMHVTGEFCPIGLSSSFATDYVYKFGKHKIDDMVHLMKRGNVWFINDIRKVINRSKK